MVAGLQLYPSVQTHWTVSLKGVNISLCKLYLNKSEFFKRKKKDAGRTSLTSNKLDFFGNSPAVQWLEDHSFTTKGTGSTPGLGTKTLQAAQRSQKKNFFF